MHVAQATSNGCVAACVAMLQRHHNVDLAADEGSVREVLGSSAASGPLNLRGIPVDLLGNSPLENDLVDFGSTLEECVVTQGPVILEVSVGLSYNFAFEHRVLRSAHGAMLKYEAPVTSYFTLGVHAVVVRSVDVIGGQVSVYDPWYAQAGQPIALTLEALFGAWMGGKAYWLR